MLSCHSGLLAHTPSQPLISIMAERAFPGLQASQDTVARIPVVAKIQYMCIKLLCLLYYKRKIHVADKVTSLVSPAEGVSQYTLL